jgi:hypothetical protein
LDERDNTNSYHIQGVSDLTIRRFAYHAWTNRAVPLTTTCYALDVLKFGNGLFITQET